MALSIVDELQTLYIKFDQAERQWLNRLDDLNDAYETAYSEFVTHLPKGGSKGDSESAVDLSSNMLLGGLALSGAPGVIAAPIVLGLKKLASLVDGPQVNPPSPNLLSLTTRLKELKKSFRDTTEHLGGEITKQLDKAKVSSNAAADEEIQKAISNLLLSPVWYPPKSSATQNMARPIEMRMWYRYWIQLGKMSDYQLQFGNIDYTPMTTHLRKIGYEPDGLEFSNTGGIHMIGGMKVTLWNGNKPLYDTIKILARHGEKNMPFHINHFYPVQVQQYLMIANMVKVGAILNSQDYSWLPTSTLTWSNVTL